MTAPIMLRVSYPAHVADRLLLNLMPDGTAEVWRWRRIPGTTWERLADDCQLIISGFGTKLGTVHLMLDGKRATIVGRIVHRLDAVDVLKRLGSPLDREVETTPRAIEDAETDARAERAELNDAIATPDERNEWEEEHDY